MGVRLEEVIGGHIADLRSHKEMSQAELGEALGEYLEKPWSRQAIHSAEKGKRAFTAAELVALALVLEAELPDLLEPPLQRRHEDVELPRGGIPAKKLAAIVAPEASDVWERRANMRMVADITPMLGGVIQTLQILHVSLDSILQEVEDKQVAEDPSSAGSMAKKRVEARAQLSAALADLLGQNQQGKDHEAALQRLKQAIDVAAGGGSDG